MKKNIKFIVAGVILLVLIIVGVILYLSQTKVKNIVIDVNNTKSYNVRVRMMPSYETIINGTSDSIIYLNVNVFPEKKLNKKVNWVTSENCAKVTNDYKLVVDGDCDFKLYAVNKGIKSNALKFSFRK